MALDPVIRHVFGHFQNLNLLVLRDDLRQGRTTLGEWTTGTNLCPIAHGLSAGAVVEELRDLSQVADLQQTCIRAARALGAPPAYVYQFVRQWDNHAFAAEWLERQIEEMWQERFADAAALEELLHSQLNEPGRNSSSSLAPPASMVYSAGV